MHFISTPRNASEAATNTVDPSHFPFDVQGHLHAGLAQGGTTGVLPTAGVFLPPGLHDRHAPNFREKVSG